MTPEQITAIAREYAEKEIATELPNITDYAKERTISAVAERTENVIRFLLRRYCLVEKSKVSEMYDVAMEISRLPKSVEARGYAISRLQTLERLFPEIAKEVEE